LEASLVQELLYTGGRVVVFQGGPEAVESSKHVQHTLLVQKNKHNSEQLCEDTSPRLLELLANASTAMNAGPVCEAVSSHAAMHQTSLPAAALLASLLANDELSCQCYNTT
jgi:hypothetical protein